MVDGGQRMVHWGMADSDVISPLDVQPKALMTMNQNGSYFYFTQIISQAWPRHVNVCPKFDTNL